VTLSGPTRVRWVEPGRVREETWTPEGFGLPRVRPDQLCISGPAESAGCIRRLLAGDRGPIRDVVLANAAAALLVAGRVETLTSGVSTAAEAIDSGAAGRLLERWAAFSRSAG
jgi:anthranilate phosphoribosyltransferase